MTLLTRTLAALEAAATKKDFDNLARFGIAAREPFGVSMANLKRIAKGIGRDHALAAALWATARHESRMLATLIDDPVQVTAAQMESWCKAFDNWGITDTACFCLFDRTPHAWAKIEAWVRRKPEFEKRAGFALLWAVALHDQAKDEGPYGKSLKWVEAGATDDRLYVKKAVNMAMRAIARRSPALRAKVVGLAYEFTESGDPAQRWVGKETLRELKTTKSRPSR
jgi:3-methyladenine DNA glycosylase AlkD